MAAAGYPAQPRSGDRIGGLPDPAAASGTGQFTDPKLQQLITLALQGNRDLRVAVLNIEQARAQYQIRGADRSRRSTRA